jgi:hypothetical protein
MIRQSSHVPDPWRATHPTGEAQPKTYSDPDPIATLRRRRIEDILEASRLEREVIGEVWEEWP